MHCRRSRQNTAIGAKALRRRSPAWVSRVIQVGRAEAQCALDQIEVILGSLAGAAYLDNFRADLEAAKRMLLLYPQT